MEPKIINKIIDLFFVTDYYAIQTVDGGYTPNRVKGVDLTIQPSDIVSSIIDKSMVIGTYTTSRDNKCKWIVFDFDSHEGKAGLIRLRGQVNEIYKRCLNYKLIPYLESSGNKGYHLWIFFDSLSSETAFNAAKILAKGNISGEIFPRQAKLKAGNRYGNLVRLPCSLNRKTGKSSTWIDFSFRPYINQVDIFSKIKKTPKELIENIASQWTIDIEEEVSQIDKTIDSSLVVDITHSVVTIHRDKNPRHRAQYILITRCLKAGYSDNKILQLGRQWLLHNRQNFSSDIEYAMLDFKNSLDYCRAIRR